MELTVQGKVESSLTFVASLMSTNVNYNEDIKKALCRYEGLKVSSHNPIFEKRRASD